MQVGDIVKIRPAVAPPHLYGIGIVIKVKGSWDQRCFVRWPTMPDKPLKSCASWALELVSASR